jgi:hypothetical protein
MIGVAIMMLTTIQRSRIFSESEPSAVGEMTRSKTTLMSSGLIRPRAAVTRIRKPTSETARLYGLKVRTMRRSVPGFAFLSGSSGGMSR